MNTVFIVVSCCLDLNKVVWVCMGVSEIHVYKICVDLLGNMYQSHHLFTSIANFTDMYLHPG